MDTTVVPIGFKNVFNLTGMDDASNARAITGTVTIDNTIVSYISKVPATANQFCFAARAGAVIPAGTNVNVNVTVNAFNDRGDPLPAVVIPYQVPGPPLPPPATHVTVSGSNTSNSAPPPDPGSDTISL